MSTSKRFSERLLNRWERRGYTDSALSNYGHRLLSECTHLRYVRKSTPTKTNVILPRFFRKTPGDTAGDNDGGSNNYGWNTEGRFVFARFISSRLLSSAACTADCLSDRSVSISVSPEAVLSF